jgi:phenylacetate-coenzyme A ligase PaaK-like adenylate-forming protein
LLLTILNKSKIEHPLELSIKDILEIDSFKTFKEIAMSVFRYQAKENKIYHAYISNLKLDIEKITELHQIPFLPIEFFKTHQLKTESPILNSKSQIFLSSGTTGTLQSKHYVSDVNVYEKSYLKAFELYYGNIKNYCVLALLPSYLEREGSSLVYMVDDLIKKSEHAESGFYLNNYDELILKLNALEAREQKTILLGVTYALLDLIEKQKFKFKNTIVMETGGMKGKRKEMVREELHAVLCEGFGVDAIHSEYGMTELLSQAYSKGDGIFNCPPWMRIIIRDVNDPFTFLPHQKTGGINVIDLENVYSCSFIATQDLGKTFPDNSFEVLGRFDNSDIRGCNLLVQ